MPWKNTFLESPRTGKGNEKRKSQRGKAKIRKKKKVADLFTGVSHSSLLGLQPNLGSLQRLQLFNNIGYSRFAVVSNRQLHLKGLTVAGAVSSDSKVPTIVTVTVGSAQGGIDIEVDTGNGGGDKFDDRSGGGGGRDNSGGGDGGNKGEGEVSDDGSRKKMALSTSHKLTLGYAALVEVGGVMGYVKSGSQKSLMAGGLSAALLYYVYTELPTKPVLASSLGLGMSVVLLGVIGSRFKRSGKVFPAGVVSLVSLVMTGGYLHGIMRSLR